MPLAEDKQIDLGLVGEGDAQIVADEMGLKTLVKNLVEDTIRHTLRGGCVDLSLRTTSTQVILQIDDTGAGIPENQRQRVFDPFNRLLSHVQERSGLGLSIVKTIATRHRAEIRLESAQPDTGIGLRVTLIFLVTGDASSPG